MPASSSSPLIIACPSCGSKSKLGTDAVGQKMKCTCGMSYSASPVFAVAPKGGGLPAWLTGLRLPRPSRKAVATAAVLLAGAGAAWWWKARPAGDPPAPADEPTAVAAAPAATFDDEPSSPPTKPAPIAAPRSESPAPAPSRPAPAASAPAAGPVVRAVKLWDAFDIDPAQAQAQYAGKAVDVSAHGRLKSDAKGWYVGGEVIKPGGKKGRLTAQEQQWERTGYPPNMLCYLAPGEEGRLTNLPPDREVVLRGTCAGRRNDPKVYRGYVVVLENCRVVP